MKKLFIINGLFLLYFIGISQSYNEKWYRIGDKLIHSNNPAAFRYFQYGSDKGYAWAQVGLGECYMEGVGCTKNTEQGMKLYFRAAAKNNPVAWHNIGYAYYLGKGVTQDYYQAFKWFSKAAKSEGLSQSYLGQCYFYGNGVEQNQKEAIKWFQKSAKGKYFSHIGQYYLAQCYYSGQGVRKNFKAAAKWFRKAANQGEPTSQYCLGLCYYNGDGVRKDVKEAIKWLRLSADNGFDMAQNNLAYFYESGLPVGEIPINKAAAITYQEKAAEQGYMPAIEAYKRLTGRDYMSKTFIIYAKSYVEFKIKEWQQKGEFETSIEYNQRVNISTRKDKVDQFYQEAENNFINYYRKDIDTKFAISRYDADNQTYVLTSDTYGNVIVPVPRKEAPAFKSKFYLDMQYSELGIFNNEIVFKNYVFQANNKYYPATSDAQYSKTDIQYNFDPIDFNNINRNTAKTFSNANITTNNIVVGQSDVNINIPETGIKNDNTFAIIIANENYQSEPSVPYAINDGTIFQEYCIKTLGIPVKQVYFRKNATKNNIDATLDWLQNLSKLNKNMNIIFYYVGHGMPDEDNKESFLLPVDGTGENIRTGYKLSELYARLGDLKVNKVSVFLDACFSGQGLNSLSRGVAVASKPADPQGNMVVFSACTKSEAAAPYQEKEHGLFTYFLLKKLKETEGNVYYKDLFQDIKENVKKASLINNKKLQTPMISFSNSISQTWGFWKFKN